MHSVQKNADTRSVNEPRPAILWFLPLIAGFVLLDEFIKFFALHTFPDESQVPVSGLFTLAIHKNFGIAFDIPFKMPFIVLISILIGIALLVVAYKNGLKRPGITLSALMIVLGAAGNLYDRLVYGFTVDYLIIFGRSAINISDVIIVTGVILLLITSRRVHQPSETSGQSTKNLTNHSH